LGYCVAGLALRVKFVRGDQRSTPIHSKQFAYAVVPSASSILNFRVAGKNSVSLDKSRTLASPATNSHL